MNKQVIQKWIKNAKPNESVIYFTGHMVEDREWDFILKIQEDQVALEKQAIKAVRDVGVAYGKNQQPTNINWISIFRL